MNSSKSILTASGSSDLGHKAQLSATPASAKVADTSPNLPDTKRTPQHPPSSSPSFIALGPRALEPPDGPSTDNSERVSARAGPDKQAAGAHTLGSTPDRNLPKRPPFQFITPPSQGKKRPFEQDPSNGPASEPLAKKPLIYHKRKHTLDQFSFPGPFGPSLQPPSPLFFSNSVHTRPTLPPRFSSSEAAAKMLSKAKTEDAHIKTVSLARGIVSSSSIPTSVPARTLSDRSGTAQSMSPDPTIKGNVSLATLDSIGIVELLEQDERPTMIVDLGNSSNYGSGQLRPLFANSSLRSYQGLIELVTGLSEDDSSDTGAMLSFVQFKSWLLSAAVDGESLNVCLPSFLYAGMSWSCSTLRKRLRIISGAHAADAASPASRRMTTRFSPTASINMEWPLSQPLTGGSSARNEPLDYFGDAAPPRGSGAAMSTSADIIPSTEMTGLLKDTSQTPETGSRSMVLRDSSETLPRLDEEAPSFDWTRLPVTDSMPSHIKFARSIDWANTALGPIELWSADLRQMCNLIMASPHPAAMYWGDDLVAIYNEAYILLAGQKHPDLMGQKYSVAWAEIWDDVKEVFASARMTGEATMKDDDCLFIKRHDYLEETYFSWSIIPMVGRDGTVMGLYNPAFEKTRRKIAERRMLTLREIGERTASARDVRAFWEQVHGALELNEYDTPFVLLYSVSDSDDSDASSVHSGSVVGAMQCFLEGSLGVPQGHVSAPEVIDYRSGVEGFGPVFREVATTNKPVLLEVGSRELPSTLIGGLRQRGFGDPCRAVVVCPIHPTTGDNVLGFLVLGVNPRRPYDEDYGLFVQLLSRQLATSLASVVLFEEEIRRGQRAAKIAALDRIELSEQLAIRTQEAIESETKFTRMAEFAPVGMFIADAEGKMTYCNDTWYDISRVSKNSINPAERWMEAIADDDRPLVAQLWHELVVDRKPITSTFRLKAPWEDRDGSVGERWVLFSAYPERYENGNLKSVFGSFTDISKQKWAEGFQKRKMEEAVEMKRQQENFIDMTSHEMRNPLSAILQCADEISTLMAQLRKKYPSEEAFTPVANGKAGPRISSELDETISNSLEAAQTIALCAQHQKRIVDDVLTLSKLDSQLLLVTPVDAQPLTVVQRALKMHEGELSSNDIQLRFVVDDSFKKLAIDWVRLDPSRVLQVLINLTTNAIKFTTTERKRTITVAIAAALERPTASGKSIVDYFPSRRPERANMFHEREWGDGEEVYVQFAVQDTGRGLTAEEKKLLFLRFSQASPRTHVQYGGSGLGLFISRELTELQGGEIGVASEAGKGSTFAFYVKARRSKGPPKADNADGKATSNKTAAMNKAVNMQMADPLTPTSAKERVRKTMHILVVEDNLVNQRVLQKQLKNMGCIVHVANHGGEALDHLRKTTFWKPDEVSAKPIALNVVLMDQEMPVMDGLTCTKKIRELEKEGNLVTHVPVIAVTANARSEQIQTALDAGMDDVVSKPFRIPDLIPKIEELMDKYPEPNSETTP